MVVKGKRAGRRRIHAHRTVKMHVCETYDLRAEEITKGEKTLAYGSCLACGATSGLVFFGPYVLREVRRQKKFARESPGVKARTVTVLERGTEQEARAEVLRQLGEKKCTRRS